MQSKEFSLYERVWLFSTSCNPFFCFYLFIFFHFLNSPLSPALDLPPPLFLFTWPRDAASSAFLSLIAASTEERECFEHISCVWGQADLQHQSCACIQTSAGPLVTPGECSLQQEPWGEQPVNSSSSTLPSKRTNFWGLSLAEVVHFTHRRW